MRAALYCALIAAALAAAPAHVASQAQALEEAFEALDAGDARKAKRTASGLSDPLARDLVQWSLLREGEGEFREYADFLNRRPDWPGLPYLQEQGEAAIPEDGDPAAIVAYFSAQSPRTGQGALALARAHLARGDRAEAEAEAIRAWTSLVMPPDVATEMRSSFGAALDEGENHVDRLDNLLWKGDRRNAREMLPLVPEGWRRLAAARMALRSRGPGVDGLIEAIPENLRDHPGLAYERFLWRMRSDLDDRAGELLESTSTSAAALGRPERWASRRAGLAREMMREGRFATCREYAANHHVAPEIHPGAFADLEWLAGYCALRLGEPGTAAAHFEAFRESVSSPISLGRAGYWLGRAHDAAGESEAAKEAYAFGARHQSSFYGQLAAERGELPTDPAFLADEDFGDWRNASFVRSDVFRAAPLLLEAGQDALAERFLTHLTESLTRQEAGQLAYYALREHENPHIALGIAKRAVRNGPPIMRAYFPVTELANARLPISPAWRLSIARRESEFDPMAVSHAGALGLMQVMPGTGREVARGLGIGFDRGRMLSDPDYNARIGSHYLAGLLRRFGDNPLLVSAAYNAGPRRTKQWLNRFGDPRNRQVDAIDWVESIPFNETRNYVMRVAESLAIYEARVSGNLPPSELGKRLNR